MSIYSRQDYTKALLELVEAAKSRPGKWTLAQMAQALGIQPSYLTNVLKGRADLNSDQLYSACEYLGVDTKGTEYLLLLLEFKRSGLKKRKEELKKKIEAVQAQQIKADVHLQVEKVKEHTPELTAYYMDPFCQLIHVCLNFPEYAKNPEKLCAKLAISENHLGEVITKLEGLGYIERTRQGYTVKIKNRHLPKESPLCQPHQTLLRYKSIDQMQRVLEKDKRSFSVTFSSTTEDKDRIYEEFLKFLKKAEQIVQNTTREKVYQINFDLFPWELT